LVGGCILRFLAALQLRAESLEEFSRDLARRAVDEPRADLRKLAADLRSSGYDR